MPSIPTQLLIRQWDHDKRDYVKEWEDFVNDQWKGQDHYEQVFPRLCLDYCQSRDIYLMLTPKLIFDATITFNGAYKCVPTGVVT